jgi:hypothetical protein
MIYTTRNVQFLGADTDPAKTAATKSDVAGMVGSIATSAGDILSSFFKMKTAQASASAVPATTVSTDTQTGEGMSQGTKTALLVGGGVAAAALLLMVAMR